MYDREKRLREHAFQMAVRRVTLNSRMRHHLYEAYDLASKGTYAWGLGSEPKYKKLADAIMSVLRELPEEYGMFLAAVGEDVETYESYFMREYDDDLEEDRKERGLPLWDRECDPAPYECPHETLLRIRLKYAGEDSDPDTAGG